VSSLIEYFRLKIFYSINLFERKREKLGKRDVLPPDFWTAKREKIAKSEIYRRMEKKRGERGRIDFSPGDFLPGSSQG